MVKPCIAAHTYTPKRVTQITVFKSRELLVFRPPCTWESGVKAVWPISCINC